MTQPYPGYPPQQAPQYPPATQNVGYPPPLQQFAPPQQYAPQFPQQQGYPAPTMAPPAAPLAQGSIDDFFNQPSAGGGKSLSFKIIGARFRGIVTRPLGNGDIQQQTDVQGRPQFFRDGRPKYVMKVPLLMQPSAEYPDGLATWFVKGQARDELARAMSEAGAPAGPPEQNAIIDIAYVGDRPAGVGFNPAKQFAIGYTRPSGETSSPIPAPAVQQPVQQYAQPAASAYAPPPPAPEPVQAAPVQYAPPAPQQVQQTAPAQQAAPAAPQPPAALSDEQRALLAKLTGQPPQ